MEGKIFAFAGHLRIFCASQLSLLHKLTLCERWNDKIYCRHRSNSMLDVVLLRFERIWRVILNLFQVWHESWPPLKTEVWALSFIWFNSSLGVASMAEKEKRNKSDSRPKFVFGGIIWATGAALQWQLPFLTNSITVWVKVEYMILVLLANWSYTIKRPHCGGLFYCNQCWLNFQNGLVKSWGTTSNKSPTTP